MRLEREPDKYFGSLSNRIQEFGFRPARNIIGDFKIAKGTRTSGVHYTLRNAFSIKSRKLLYQVVILHQNWTIGTSGLRVLIVHNGRARFGSKRFFVVWHVMSPHCSAKS